MKVPAHINCHVIKQAAAAREMKEQQRVSRRCTNCGKTETSKHILSWCAKCKKVQYCGRDCQVKHWSETHKKECKRLRAEIRLEEKHDLVGDDILQVVRMNPIRMASSGDTKVDGSYKRPSGVQPGQVFMIKVQRRTAKEAMLVYDESRECLFYVRPDQVGFDELYAAVSAQKAADGMKTYIEASFDNSDVMTVYPETSSMQLW